MTLATFPIETTAAIERALAVHAPVAMNVSGGRDSAALAIAVNEYLDERGHCGPRTLVNAHLGLIEWHESIRQNEMLARRLDLELMLVRGSEHGMIGTWGARWDRNVERYRTVRCARLILPFSTPRIRFCTAREKSDPIARALVARFPGCKDILSAAGIRREESTKRAAAVVARANPRLRRVRAGTTGFDWHPILGWTLAQVTRFLEKRRVPLHPAYTVYGSRRVSCSFCIMSSADDLAAAARCATNADAYRAIVALEVSSTFAFQGTRWLGDVAPALLDATLRNALERAKAKALARVRAEARIPRHLLFHDGWPICVPSISDARLLADVRREAADVIGITNCEYTEAEAVRARYAELCETRRFKEAKRRPAPPRVQVDLFAA